MNSGDYPAGMPELPGKTLFEDAEMIGYTVEQTQAYGRQCYEAGRAAAFARGLLKCSSEGIAQPECAAQARAQALEDAADAVYLLWSPGPIEDDDFEGQAGNEAIRHAYNAIRALKGPKT